MAKINLEKYMVLNIELFRSIQWEKGAKTKNTIKYLIMKGIKN
ncbi:hypothetical protein ADICYQ_4779 [Cyclobacterium qasimii M12-11B]|uniref:Uncharacterized protein n=1 Tax=Cyclobacterium qasimii M12-11B TaxID=641524 RepID=S7V823_9BACT|nr:hypothetical protein ADICYQ_4779 [Cyclobacterium qasimii M12-11B]